MTKNRWLFHFTRVGDSHFRPQEEKKQAIGTILSCLTRVYTYFAPRSAYASWLRSKRNPTKAQIAQLVEQLAFNQLVLGSSPSLRTFFSLHPPPRRVFCFSSLTHPCPKQTGTRTLAEAPCKGGRATGFDCTNARASRAIIQPEFRRRNSALPQSLSGAMAIPVYVISLPLHPPEWRVFHCP